MTQLSTSRTPGGFTEKTARVNGVTLNYATGGTGPAVVLLHGYPQTWYMWLLELLGPGQASSSLKPWRHEGWRGSQPSSALALALEKPRASVIIITAMSPASIRASHRGTRIGGFAPAHAAR